MLHIYPMCGIFDLPSIDTGTRDCQFNVSFKQHPVGILMTKVCGNFWVFHQWDQTWDQHSGQASKPLGHPVCIGSPVK